MAVITISREYGSRGEEIAQQVAQGMGYNYFDKEILADVARATDTTEDRISSFDEKDEHGLRAFLKKLFLPDYPRFVNYPYYPGIPIEWAPGYVEKEPILDANEVIPVFRDVVEKLWKRDNVVIVGRGSQKILAAKPNTFHVRFVGRLNDRKKEVMAKENLSADEALKKIDAIDEQRAHYLKHYYDVELADPRFYHLLINTSLMSTEQAANLIITAVQHRNKPQEET